MARPRESPLGDDAQAVRDPPRHRAHVAAHTRGRSTHPFLTQKPENALKRANELSAIGNEKGALQVLHDVLTAKKSRTWVKVLESIMLKYIDIAVDLKLHRHAKDGLHQYRNISQQQAPQSLEAIIQHLLKAGESRVAKAAKEARSMNLGKGKAVAPPKKRVSSKPSGSGGLATTAPMSGPLCGGSTTATGCSST